MSRDNTDLLAAVNQLVDQLASSGEQQAERYLDIQKRIIGGERLLVKLLEGQEAHGDRIAYLERRERLKTIVLWIMTITGLVATFGTIVLFVILASR